MPAGKGVVEGGEIPYQPWAAAKKLENFTNRQTADPVGKCYFPGVPRIMYMEFPFQIFQTPEHVAITFEWSQVYRLIYTNGKPALHEGIDSWMGDSRGHWEGDTLVVEVTGQNDKTWFDMAGDFHSDALHGDRAIYDARRRYHPVRSHDRGSQGVHEILEDQHAAGAAEEHGPDPGIPVPGGSGGGQRRFRARSAHLVSGPGRAAVAAGKASRDAAGRQLCRR